LVSSSPVARLPGRAVRSCEHFAPVYAVWAHDVDSSPTDTFMCFVQSPEGLLLMHTFVCFFHDSEEPLPAHTSKTFGMIPKDQFVRSRPRIYVARPKTYDGRTRFFSPSVSPPKKQDSMQERRFPRLLRSPSTSHRPAEAGQRSVDSIACGALLFSMTKRRDDLSSNLRAGLTVHAPRNRRSNYLVCVWPSSSVHRSLASGRRVFRFDIL
jgi:hypothetical protein